MIKPEEQKWIAANRRKGLGVCRHVVVDFDGVIAQYDGWKGPDHFGEAMPYAREALQELAEWGLLVIVWTTREDTLQLRDWLTDHGIRPYAINSCEHNPPNTSSKPVAEIYIDDRSWYDVRRRFSWVRVMRRLRKLYQPPRDTFIDDAAVWASPVQRLGVWVATCVRRLIRKLAVI